MDSSEKRILFQSKGFPEFRFLSNFHVCRIEDEFGQTYHSVEQAYQCAKANTEEDWYLVKDCATPAEARRAGSKVKLSENWSEQKDHHMEKYVRYKFFQNKDLAELLLATEDFELVEYAPWGDTYWGVDKELKGENRLGKILMKVRGELKEREGK